VDQALLPQCDFDGIPNAGTGFLGRAQITGGSNNEVQFRDQSRARWTRLKMIPLLGTLALLNLCQASL
jgi:hypothetical protein